MNTLKLLCVGLAISLISGCQTTGGSYTTETVAREPHRADYAADHEFAAALIAHIFPRRCRFNITQGNIPVRSNLKPIQFSFGQVISNSPDDGWYVANVKPERSGTAQGTLTIYANGRTGQWACGNGHLARVAPGLSFSTGRFFDVNLSAGAAKGTVTSGTPARSYNVPIKTACQMAIAKNGNNFAWETRRTYTKYVDQAQAASLTPEDCAKMAGQT